MREYNVGPVRNSSLRPRTPTKDEQEKKRACKQTTVVVTLAATSVSVKWRRQSP